LQDQKLPLKSNLTEKLSDERSKLRKQEEIKLRSDLIKKEELFSKQKSSLISDFENRKSNLNLEFNKKRKELELNFRNKERLSVRERSKHNFVLQFFNIITYFWKRINIYHFSLDKFNF